MDYQKFFQEKYVEEDPWHFEHSLYERVRHTAMVEFVLNSNPERVVDLGCGEGHFLSRLLQRKPELEAVGIELVAAAAERCRARLGSEVEIINSDLLAYLSKGKEKEFDAVVCGDVLYYLSPDVVRDSVIPGIRKLLKPGGSLVISYTDVNDHQWLDQVFAAGFQKGNQIYLKPLQAPPPWPWIISLFKKEE